MQDKIEKMQQIMGILNNNLSKKDFEDNFKVIIELVRKLQTNHSESLKEMNGKYDEIVGSVKNDLRNTPLYQEIVNAIKSDAVMNVEEMKQKTTELVLSELGKMMSEHKGMMDSLEGRIGSMKKELMPDMNGLTNKAHDMLKGKVETTIMRVVKEYIVKFANLIVKALTNLPDKEKLQIKSINNLQEELDKLKHSIESKVFTFGAVSGGGGVGKHNVVYYDLSDSLDGGTRTFSLPAFYDIIDVKLSSVPVCRKTNDYTVDVGNNQITFTSEITDLDLSAGQTCILLLSE